MHRIGRALRHTLFSAPTYLRQVHLLLGAALALAFALVDLGVVGTFLGAGVSQPVVAAVGVVGALVPPALVGLLPAVRQVEGVAVESLLGVTFPGGPPGPATTWPQRRRASAWFLVHVTFGFLVGCALAIAVPLAIIGILTAVGGDKAWWLLPGALVLLLGSLAGCLGLGAAATAIAPRLLGPSAEDRVHALERRAARLSERTRLARELHDSVGHALSLVVVQAGAARKVRDTDPAFVDGALEAVEEAARTALTDLDQVLGLLRDEEAGAVGGPRPIADLDQLDGLVAATRQAGLEVRLAVDGDVDRVPAVVSRESYRIIQEALTNALRHGESTVEVRLSVGAETFVIEAANPIAPGRRSRRGGRGLRGIRERANVLGGDMSAGGQDDRWRLQVRLPLPDEEIR
ncbi:MAG TPA: histidine kinase [Nocardioidaceae bacterium]|nr:histidine kinase [Nocardioidaceae bacterium]